MGRRGRARGWPAKLAGALAGGWKQRFIGSRLWPRLDGETRLHIECADLARQRLREGVVMFHAPSGARFASRALQGAILKAMGWRAGWPDLTFMAPGPVWHLAEIKMPEGKVNPDQKALHTAFRAGGQEVAIIRSLAQFEVWAQNRGLIDG